MLGFSETLINNIKNWHAPPGRPPLLSFRTPGLMASGFGLGVIVLIGCGKCLLGSVMTTAKTGDAPEDGHLGVLD
jgi:hypothetical protein